MARSPVKGRLTLSAVRMRKSTLTRWKSTTVSQIRGRIWHRLLNACVPLPSVRLGQKFTFSGDKMSRLKVIAFMRKGVVITFAMTHALILIYRRTCVGNFFQQPFFKFYAKSQKKKNVQSNRQRVKVNSNYAILTVTNMSYAHILEESFIMNYDSKTLSRTFLERVKTNPPFVLTRNFQTFTFLVCLGLPEIVTKANKKYGRTVRVGYAGTYRVN